MLRGDVVGLRERRDDDEDLLYAFAADLDTWEQRTAAAPTSITRAEFHAKFAEPTAADTSRFVIVVGDRAVGRCDLFNEDTLARHAEVGITIAADERGKGYGTDALRALVDFAFARRNLRRVYLSVLASNAAALASYVKVGFVEEGRLREHSWVRGRYVDEVQMGLLRSEWTWRPPAARAR